MNSLRLVWNNSFRLLKTNFLKNNTQVIVDKRKKLKLLLISAVGINYWNYKSSSFESFALHDNEDLVFIKKADLLYEEGNVSELYGYLKSYELHENAEVLWRLSRAARDYALKDKTLDKTRKKELHYESFEFAKRALNVDQENFGSHKWFAITIGDIGDYEGTKTKIKNSFLIKEHYEKAIELNPSDATSIYCLGMWCYTFADMPGWQRRMAAWIFNTPPSSTYDEALAHFLKAEEVDPNFYSSNLLMIGKVYMKTGEKEKAKSFLLKTLNYNAKTEEDFDNIEEAKSLLNTLK